MHTLKITETFSAAHNLREYKGKCEKLHGHNWKVEAAVCGTKLDPAGMLMDFHDLKDLLRSVLAKLDHSYLNEIEPFDHLNPTSENLASYIYHLMQARLKDKNVRMEQVTVWESDTASATYKE